MSWMTLYNPLPPAPKWTSKEAMELAQAITQLRTYVDVLPAEAKDIPEETLRKQFNEAGVLLAQARSAAAILCNVDGPDKAEGCLAAADLARFGTNVKNKMQGELDQRSLLHEISNSLSNPNMWILGGALVLGATVVWDGYRKKGGR